MKITIVERHLAIEAPDSVFSNVAKMDIEQILRACYLNQSDPANAPAAEVVTIDGEVITSTDDQGTGLALAASAEEQTEFEWREATQDDVLEYIQAYAGVVEYEFDDAAEVLDSLTSVGLTETIRRNQGPEGLLRSITASAAYTTNGLTPAKPLGDLAQTSVVTGNGQTQVIGLGKWSMSWKRKTVEANTTDDAEYESNLGSTKGWTAKADYMFIDGDPSQATEILAVITTQGSPNYTWNFFPTIGTGRAAFQGQAIIDGIDFSAGVGTVCALGVSLKGNGPLLVLAQAAPVANTTTITGQSAQV